MTGFAVYLRSVFRTHTMVWAVVLCLSARPQPGHAQAAGQDGTAEAPERPPNEHDDAGGWGEEADEDFADADAFADLAQSMQSMQAMQEAPANQTGPTEPGAGELSVSGFLRHRGGLWVERLGSLPLAQARTSVDISMRYKRPLSVPGLDLSYRIVADLHLEYDLAYQVDRDQYDAATLEAYESQLIGGETFLSVSLGAVDLAVGRQIVAWGQGDLFSVVDIVNPRDLREPGLAELDDIRLAVFATRVGVFSGAHRVEFLAIHEANWGLRPAPLSPFSPLRKLLTEDPAVGAFLAGRALAWTDDPDGIALDGRTQWLARWQYNGPGLDLSLHAAYTREPQGVLALPELSAMTTGAAGGSLGVPLTHPAYGMFGHAGAAPLGDFVFKWEAVVDVNRPITAQGDGPLSVTGIRRTQLGWLLGATYGGIADGSLSLEYAGRFLPKHPKRIQGDARRILFPVEAPSLGLLFRQTYLRETLSLNATVVSFGLAPVLGVVGRAEVTYALGDGLSVGLGAATYHPHPTRFGPLFGFSRNDRLYSTLRYDFLLD